MNKHGWGLRIELAFVLLFIVCILVSTILLHRMHIFGNNDNYDYSGGNYNYGALEASVVNAAKRYYNEKYYGTSSDTIIVNVNTLKNSGYLNPIYSIRWQKVSTAVICEKMMVPLINFCSVRS